MKTEDHARFDAAWWRANKAKTLNDSGAVERALSAYQAALTASGSGGSGGGKAVVQRLVTAIRGLLDALIAAIRKCDSRHNETRAVLLEYCELLPRPADLIPLEKALADFAQARESHRGLNPDVFARRTRALDAVAGQIDAFIPKLNVQLADVSGIFRQSLAGLKLRKEACAGAHDVQQALGLLALAILTANPVVDEKQGIVYYLDQFKSFSDQEKRQFFRAVDTKLANLLNVQVSLLEDSLRVGGLATIATHHGRRVAHLAKVLIVHNGRNQLLQYTEQSDLKKLQITLDRIRANMKKLGVEAERARGAILTFMLQTLDVDA
jgi:hypothetical protein